VLFISKGGRKLQKGPNRLGNRLREARKAKGLSQKEVAKQLGISHNYYWLKEKGRTLPFRGKSVKKLSKILDVPFEELTELACNDWFWQDEERY